MKESNPFYHSKEWKAARAARLQLDHGMCVECMQRFAGGGMKPRRATMVHHVIPLSERPDLALDLDNLRSLCDICHNREHPEKGGRGRAAGRTKRPTQIRIIKV